VSTQCVWREITITRDPRYRDEQVACVECDRAVDERATVVEEWRYFSDGTGELLPYCPTCAAREFGPASGPRARS